ncbi:helix-turn-helix domain-containing protein [Pantoea sp. AMG 501]|uniref:helix-turn-helix domain-containing protein n=1 Tax=Pantoea sp. AMG 501 TaxID=2008894 RepID=UPI000B5A401A|nr:helix-turn-helix domain-containing protein [Pantoea sp. AMG 501]OWY76865.1 phage repressor protein CI [Pantoea sp. AMG 501]
MSVAFENVREILSRILSSYGVKTQQAYAELKNMPVGTIHNWIKRGRIPGDYIVTCTLDTGADVNWLVNGELANVELTPSASYPIKGQRLLDTMQASGGKVILSRLMDAYGFTMQKQLGEHLGIPSGTMSAWLRRDHFPGEVVIACALDTGASLYWLATGNGSKHDISPSNINESELVITIVKHQLSGGQLIEQGQIYFDKSLLVKEIINPLVVEKGAMIFVLDAGSEKISNGSWLIDIDGVTDIYEVIRLPGNKIKLSNDNASFECAVSDVKPLGFNVLTVKKTM